MQFGLFLLNVQKIKAQLEIIREQEEVLRALALATYQLGENNTVPAQTAIQAINAASKEIGVIFSRLRSLKTFLPTSTSSLGDPTFRGFISITYEAQATSQIKLAIGPYTSLPINIYSSSGNAYSAVNVPFPAVPEGVEQLDALVLTENGLEAQNLASADVLGEDRYFLEEVEPTIQYYRYRTANGTNILPSSHRAQGIESAKSVAKQLGGQVIKTPIVEGQLTFAFEGGITTLISHVIQTECTISLEVSGTTEIYRYSPSAGLQPYMSVSLDPIMGGTYLGSVFTEEVVLNNVGTAGSDTNHVDSESITHRYQVGVKDLAVGDVVVSDTVAFVLDTRPGGIISTDQQVLGEAKAYQGSYFVLDKILSAQETAPTLALGRLSTKSDADLVAEYSAALSRYIRELSTKLNTKLAPKQSAAIVSTLRTIIRAHQESGYDRAADYLASARIVEYAQLNDRSCSYNALLADQIGRFQAEVRL